LRRRDHHSAGGTFTLGHVSKFQNATSFLFDQAFPGALAVAVKVHDHDDDHVDVAN